MVSLRLAQLCLLLTPLVGPAQPAKPRLDAHGFPLPEGAIARLGSLKFTEGGWADVIALSPDGKLVASAGGTSFSVGRDGNLVSTPNTAVTIWEADTAKLVRKVYAVGASVRLAWSKSGQLIASMDPTGKFRIWDARTGARRWDSWAETSQGGERLTDLRFLADDELLAVVLSDARVELWDVETGKLSQAWGVDLEKRKKLKALGADYRIADVALSPSGERMAWLAMPSDRETPGAVFLYDTQTGRLLSEAKGLPLAGGLDLPDEGETLVLHPPWPWLAEQKEKKLTPEFSVVNGADGQVRWRCAYRGQRADFMGLRGRGAVRFHDALLTLDGVGMVRWDFKTGKKLAEGRQVFSGLALAHDGKRLAVLQGTRLHIDAGPLEELFRLGEAWEVPLVGFLRDGRLLGRREGQRIQVWDLRQAAVTDSVKIFPANLGLLLGRHRYMGPTSPDYDWMARDARGKLEAIRLDWGGNPVGMAVYDLVSNKRACTLDGLSAEDISFHFPFVSGDGKRVLLSPDRELGRVRWHDTRSGRQLGQYKLPEPEVGLGAFQAHPRTQWYSDDGTLFGYIQPDSRLALVNCEQGKVVQVIGRETELKKLAPGLQFSTRLWEYKSVGHHRLILAYRPSFLEDLKEASEFKDIRPEYVLYDHHGETLRWFPLDESRKAKHLLSSDGRALASVDAGRREVDLYETATARKFGRLTLPYLPRTLDFSPDSALLATGSERDATVLVWDLQRALEGQREQPTPKTAAEAEALWDLLGRTDPTEAKPAAHALVRAPEQTLALLEKHLPGARTASAKQVQEWIGQLDSQQFKMRQTATQELLSLGIAVLPALRAALKTPTSLEQRLRLEQLVERLATSNITGPNALPRCLRELRALEVLERLGSVAARRLVERLVASPPDALLRAEARLILARWGDRVRP